MNESPELFRKLGETLCSVPLNCADREGTNEVIEQWEAMLCKGMKMFPHIQQLTLIFPENFRLEQLPTFHSFAELKLKSLHIENIACSKDELLDFLLCHKATLKQLDIFQVCIVGPPGSLHSLVNAILENLSLENCTMADCRAFSGRAAFLLPSSFIYGGREKWSDQLELLAEGDFED